MVNRPSDDHHDIGGGLVDGEWRSRSSWLPLGLFTVQPYVVCVGKCATEVNRVAVIWSSRPDQTSGGRVIISVLITHGPLSLSVHLYDLFVNSQK